MRRGASWSTWGFRFNYVSMKYKRIPEREWEELSILARGHFQHLNDCCKLAAERGESNRKNRFLQEMILLAAGYPERWREIAMIVPKGSEEWNNAIEETWKMTRGAKAIHPWRELRKLLPRGHPLYTKVQNKLREFKAQN